MANPETAVFPSALSTDTNLLVVSDRFTARLQVGIDSDDTSIILDDASSLNVPCVITIDNEQIRIASKISNTLTVGARAHGGTVAADHAANAIVYANLVATHINRLAAELIAIQTALGVNLSNALLNPLTANLDGDGFRIFDAVYNEKRTAPTIAAGTLTLDCSSGNLFDVSLNANITTLSLTNAPTTGIVYSAILRFTMDGTPRSVTWGASVKFPGGSAPTLTSTNAKVDTFALMTVDGGTSWFAFVVGQNS